jgi:hypothetical protein
MAKSFSWEGTEPMFLTELAPLLRDCLAQPIAFVGGIAAGALGLNLQDEPVRTWLARHGGVNAAHPANPANPTDGPQSIAID